MLMRCASLNSNLYAVLTCPVVSDSLQPHGLYPARLLCPWGFSRQEYQSRLPCPPPGDFPNPGIEPRSALLVDSLPTEPPGKPNNTVVGSLSLLQGSSQPRNQTTVFCIASGFFTSWATREAHKFKSNKYKLWLYLTLHPNYSFFTWFWHSGIYQRFTYLRLQA